MRAHSRPCEASSLAADSMADRASPGRPADPRDRAHLAHPAAHSLRRRGIAPAVLSYCDDARPHCPSCSSAIPAPSAARSLPGSISRAPPYHSAARPHLPRPSSMSPTWTRRSARLLSSPPAASSAALYGPSRSAPGGSSCGAPPARASQHLMHSEAHFDLRFLRFFSLWASRGAPAPPSSPSAYWTAFPYHTTASASLPPPSSRAAILPHRSEHCAHTQCILTARSRHSSASSSLPSSPCRLPQAAYSLAHSILAFLSSTRPVISASMRLASGHRPADSPPSSPAAAGMALPRATGL